MTPCPVLVANRGEIAVRIIRACSALGLRSIALHTPAERHALFVELADSAVCVEIVDDVPLYLHAELIVKTALNIGAGAIHPGYGFLAESAEFAQLCDDYGLIFVGPDASVIELMGNKGRARKMASASGVRIIPGFDDDCDVCSLHQQADDLGYPLMIKACSGGGGKGMRRIENSDQFIENLNTVRSEAKSAFGNDEVIIERSLSGCRHIEVQVLADNFGRCIHLFDRDCSWQRRQQKLIEEAPACNIPTGVRESMFAQALSLCMHIGYSNAGTVEYLYDPVSELFYFLEMNTRLQVEHPVTELITGVDIVQWQLCIALRGVLDIDQEDIICTGHSIEVRVLAENPWENFRLATGTVNYLQWPTSSDIRIDSGIQVKDRIDVGYDSMLAKIIAYGNNRQSAIQHLSKAIDKTRLIGIDTALKAQQQLLLSAEFYHINHTTDALDKGFPISNITFDFCIIAELALARFLTLLNEGHHSSLWQELSGWRITNSFKPTQHWLFFEDCDQSYSVSIKKTQQALQCSVNNVEVITAHYVSLDQHMLRYYSGEERIERFIFIDQSSYWHESYSSNCFTAVIQPSQKGSDPLTDNQLAIRAPIPGKLVELHVILGDAVEVGQSVCVIEAMKQFITLKSTIRAKVKSVRCAVGQSVEQSALLLELEY